MTTPRYVPVDDDGLEKKAKHPKWSLPNTDLAKRALAICGRKYYLRGEKGRWLKIEKAMMPLAPGIESVYPSEWVEHMLTWASRKNRTGIVITFPRLLNGLENESYKTDFIAEWQAKNKSQEITPEAREKAEAPAEDAEAFDWS